MCGEKLILLEITAAQKGSPPRVRGKGRPQADGLPVLGITPACAGKSTYPGTLLGADQDHPRVCGEKHTASSTASACMGSPPRVRRKAFSGFFLRCFCRDHPRVCGEKEVVVEFINWQTGSPPRMRGKATSQRPAACRRRITPAYAGKSSSCTRHSSRSWDHPRVCGEKRLRPRKSMKQTGSPPHMRGKVHAVEALKHPGGITPAYAGKSDAAAARCEAS